MLFMLGVVEGYLLIVSRFRDAGICCETFYGRRVSFGEQAVYCKKKGIRYIVVVGRDEIHV